MTEIEGKPGLDDLVHREPTIEEAATAAAPTLDPVAAGVLAAIEDEGANGIPEPEVIELRACPCGEVPKGLYVELANPTEMGAKMGAASASCCGSWRVEFLNRFAQGEDSLRLAVAAWNEAPRP